MILVLFGAILPDIDNTKSKIGKRFKLVGFLFAHRGIFHSIFAIIVFTFLLSLITESYLAFGLGYLSHLVADSLTVAGISFFYPLSSKRIRGFIKTGSVIEWIIFAIVLLYTVKYILQ